MIRLGDPDLGDDDIAAVAEVLRTGFLVQGRHVQEFEARIAALLGCKHAIAVSSGTAALHLAVLGAGLGSGAEVIVPDFTWPATANVVEVCGARAVLVDIDAATYNIDVRCLDRAVTPRTRAIIPVDLFGLPADMDPVLEVARARGLIVIEDAACALGAEYRGRKCGTLGDVGCFSFHPRKTVTTGEGGMLTTNDDGLAQRLRSLRNHGVVPAAGGPQFVAAGLNYRLTDFQAALGVSQMHRLAGTLALRRRLAQAYHEALADCPHLVRPVCPGHCLHSWQAYVVTLADGIERSRIQAALGQAGIETAIGTYALSAQPCYQAHGSACPVAQRAFRQALSLPMHTRLTEADVAVVARTLTRLLQSGG